MHSSAIWEIPEFLDPRINRGIFPFFLNAFLSGRKFGENKTIKRILHDLKWCLRHAYNVMSMDMAKDLLVVQGNVKRKVMKSQISI